MESSYIYKARCRFFCFLPARLPQTCFTTQYTVSVNYYGVDAMPCMNFKVSGSASASAAS